MTTIEIPTPDLKVRHYYDFVVDDEDTEVDVTFQLMFGHYRVVEKTYSVPRKDYEDIHLMDSRDDFDEYVAERLSRLFT